jgi:hypothetical protein
MREKARFVLGAMEQRMSALGFGWADVTATQAYTIFDIHPLLADERNCLGAHGISGAEGRPAVPSTWRRQPALDPGRVETPETVISAQQRNLSCASTNPLELACATTADFLALDRADRASGSGGLVDTVLDRASRRHRHHRRDHEPFEQHVRYRGADNDGLHRRGYALLHRCVSAAGIVAGLRHRRVRLHLHPRPAGADRDPPAT